MTHSPKCFGHMDWFTTGHCELCKFSSICYKLSFEGLENEQNKVKTKEHEWVKQGYVVGFMTDKGIILDLDNMTYRKVRYLARTLCREHRLEGYIIVRSSPRNYHVVFNRYLRWKTITTILFSMWEAVRWAVFQLREGGLTLRISRKNGKNKPKIVFKTGKTNKSIKEYMDVYEHFKRL